MKNKGSIFIFVIILLTILTNFMLYFAKYLIIKKKIYELNNVKIDKNNLKKRILNSEIINIDINNYTKIDNINYSRDILFFKINIKYDEKLLDIEVIENE